MRCCVASGLSNSHCRSCDTSTRDRAGECTFHSAGGPPPSRSEVVLLPPGHLVHQVGQKSEQKHQWGDIAPGAGLFVLRADGPAGRAPLEFPAFPGQGAARACSAPAGRDPAPSSPQHPPPLRVPRRQPGLLAPRTWPAPASPSVAPACVGAPGAAWGPQGGVCHCWKIYEQFINVFYRQLLVCAEQYSFCQGKLVTGL